MCGIVCVHAKDARSAIGLTKFLYKNQKERGSWGFGYIAIDGYGNLVSTARATREDRIFKLLEEETEARTIIFHHRLPTSNSNKVKSAHPFDCQIFDKRVFTIHNGVLHGYETVLAIHKSENLFYRSEDYGSVNDSEVLAWEIAKWRAGLLDDKELGVYGSAAVVVVEKDNNKVRILAYRNFANPLLLNTYEDGARSITSQLPANIRGEMLSVDTWWEFSTDLEIVSECEGPTIPYMRDIVGFHSFRR